MLIDEPQLSSPVEGPPRGSRNRNNICYYEGRCLEEMASFDGKSWDRQELRDLHNLFIRLAV
jgi:hypothetical protein